MTPSIIPDKDTALQLLWLWLIFVVAFLIAYYVVKKSSSHKGEKQAYAKALRQRLVRTRRRLAPSTKKRSPKKGPKDK